MLLSKQEIYKYIVDIVTEKAESKDVSKEDEAQNIGIPRTTWYEIKRQSKGKGNDNIISTSKLIEIAALVGLKVNKDIFEVEVIAK